MIPEYSQPREMGPGTDSEDFTSASGAESTSGTFSNDGEKDPHDGLVLTIKSDLVSGQFNTEVKDQDYHAGLMLKLSHLPEQDRKRMFKMLTNSNAIATSLYDLTPSTVPYEHSFELMDDTPVYHRARRMAPKHNELVRKELDMMLKAGIISPLCRSGRFLLSSL